LCCPSSAGLYPLFLLIASGDRHVPSRPLQSPTVSWGPWLPSLKTCQPSIFSMQGRLDGIRTPTGVPHPVGSPLPAFKSLYSHLRLADFPGNYSLVRFFLTRHGDDGFSSLHPTPFYLPQTVLCLRVPVSPPSFASIHPVFILHNHGSLTDFFTPSVTPLFSPPLKAPPLTMFHLLFDFTPFLPPKFCTAPPLSPSSESPPHL